MHKVALAGCGRISKNHIDSIQKLKDEGLAELVACCDIIPERAKTAADKIGSGCRLYTD
jgi:UDP-N-acetyl-2-amino-2-deoxyglucuronate dehydrogenase